MIEQSVSLASNGSVQVPGYEHLARFGYTKNRGVYRLAVTASGEWEGLIIRCFWHVPDGKDPASSLVVDGYVDVPASVTAQPGSGCITFEVSCQRQQRHGGRHHAGAGNPCMAAAGGCRAHRCHRRRAGQDRCTDGSTAGWGICQKGRAGPF